MQTPTPRQLHGMVQLVEQAVDINVTGIHAAQKTYAGYSYTVLRQVRPIAGPVRVVESAQDVITDAVFWSIRLGNRLSCGLAAGALNVIDQVCQQPDQA